MAKTRSGLGRGLGSLLGAPEGTVAETSPRPAPRIAVQPTELEEKPEAVTEAVPEEPEQKPEVKAELPVDAKPEETAQPEPEIVETGDIYSSKEDNITIKGVVSRAARPAPISQRIEESVDNVLQTTDEIPVDLIEPNPDQPRTNFKSDELEELAESIKRNGLLQPILVRKVDGKYQIIAGERRWQACKSIGMKTIPARIKDAGDDESIILALIENIQRSNLNPIEEAYGYRRMMERYKMTQSEVAQAVSKGRTTITNALRLLELPEDAQQLLFEEKITAGHARAILSVPTKEGRRKLTDKLVDENLSVRDAERIARLLSGKTKEPSAPRQQAPKSYKTVARALKDALDAEVKIKSVRGKNKIEILFKDQADLERLFLKITRG